MASLPTMALVERLSPPVVVLWAAEISPICHLHSNASFALDGTVITLVTSPSFFTKNSPPAPVILKCSKVSVFIHSLLLNIGTLLTNAVTHMDVPESARD